MNRHAITMMFVRLSVHLGRAWIVIIRSMLLQIEVYGWIVQCSGHSDTKAFPAIFFSSTWKRCGVWMCKLGMLSRERLKIEIMLLLSADRKSYVLHRLAQ